MKTIQRSGLLVFVVFSHYFPVFKGTTDLAGRIVFVGIFYPL